MEFNVKKSNIISITNATSNKIRYQYTMDGEPVGLLTVNRLTGP